jgi:hypothetical protein
MKRIFWLIVVVAVICAGFLTLRDKKNSAQENNGTSEIQKAEENGAQSNAVFEAKTEAVSQEDSFYNIKAEYPQFDFAGQSFNEKISGLISEKIEIFKKDAKDYWEARKATALEGEVVPENPDQPFDFVAEWKPSRVDDKFISFYLNAYYFSGGAHGISEILGFNYDVAGQKEITINDFLGNSQENLEILSLLAKKEIVYQLQSEGMDTDGFVGQMIDDGAAATYDNYENFNFNDSSLIIYFQQYQVAPGTVGQITVTLNKEYLEQNSITSNYLR